MNTVQVCVGFVLLSISPAIAVGSSLVDARLLAAVAVLAALVGACGALASDSFRTDGRVEAP